ncbi:MAG TPA: hypothetical protein VMB81_01200 [Candidatus Sulfotelmatobacter sp.]|nr:hypothetical protein [Candidatus Sulfotelmatobacter sp.]
MAAGLGACAGFTPADAVRAPGPGAATRPFDGLWQGVGTPASGRVGMGSIMCTPMTVRFAVAGGKFVGGARRLSIGVRPWIEYVDFQGAIDDAGVLEGTMRFRYDRDPWFLDPTGVPVAGRADGAQINASYAASYCYYDFVFTRVPPTPGHADGTRS